MIRCTVDFWPARLQFVKINMPEQDSEPPLRLFLFFSKSQLLVVSAKRRRTSKPVVGRKHAKQQNKVLKEALTQFLQKDRISFVGFWVTGPRLCPSMGWSSVQAGFLHPSWAYLWGKGKEHSLHKHGPKCMLNSFSWFLVPLTWVKLLIKALNYQMFFISWFDICNQLSDCSVKYKAHFPVHLWHSCTSFTIPVHLSFHLFPSTYLVPGCGCSSPSIHSSTSSSGSSRNKQAYSRTTALIPPIHFWNET